MKFKHCTVAHAHILDVRVFRILAIVCAFPRMPRTELRVEVRDELVSRDSR